MNTLYLQTGYGLALMLSCCLMLTIVWIFSLGRIYVRFFLLRLWRMDDWLFILSLFSFNLLISSNIISTLHGCGQYLQDIRPDDVATATKFLAYGKVFYTQTIIFTRLSVGFFLLQLVPRTQGYRLAILYTLLLISALGVLLFFVNISQTFSISDVRDPYPTPSTLRILSTDIVPVLCVIHASIGTITDVFFAILPINLIYNLSIPIKTKITTCILLSLGLIAGLTNLVRIFYTITMPRGIEMLHHAAKVTIWSMVEPATAISCLGVSSWKPLICGFKKDTLTPVFEEKAEDVV